jgi:hypothetical protein
MSPLLIAVIAALAGGVITYLLNLSSQSRANFATRTNAIAAVESEFAAAKQRIEAVGEAGGLWPPRYSLLGDAWGTFGWQLPSLLGKGEVDKIKVTRSLMEAVDGWVRRLQESGAKEVPGDLVKEIEDLDRRLESALKILAGALGDAKSELKRTRIATGLAVVTIAVAVVAGAVLPGVSGGPAVTNSSIAKRLQAEMSSSNSAVCDESEVFDGAFRCVVAYGGCGHQLEASTDKPACSGLKGKVLNVMADENCYEAAIIKVIKNGARATQPPGEPSREELHAGCIDK